MISNARLMQLTGLSLRGVNSALARLQAEGVVAVEPYRPTEFGDYRRRRLCLLA